jgi:GDP-mannose 6-dehydrogenase
MPGTNQKVIDIIEAISGKNHDIDFAVVSNPEFLREGNAINDFFSPPYTVVASECERGVKVIRELYSFINRPVFQVDVKIAELIKFINNSFHALKVSFANEVGRLCNALNTDSHELMDLFVSDTDLNISQKYFRPGFSYGGSCLPKDLRALQTIAHDKYLELPILQAIDKSNSVNLQSVYDRILQFGNVHVGIYGLSFKEGTDDLRFSPSLELVERLIGKGIKVTVFDRNVNTSRLIGKNRDFLFTHLPYANNILENDLSVVLKNSDILLITQNVISDDANLIRINSQKRFIPILDLFRTKELESIEGYSGISW